MKVPRSRAPEVSATGWGKTMPVDAHEPNAVLLKVDMKVMATERCRSCRVMGRTRSTTR